MDIFSSLKISSSALRAQRTRLNTISSNLANIETTRTPEGGPYRKREVVFQSSAGSFSERLDRSMRGAVQGVEVAEIRTSSAPPKMVYDPGHPDADDKGFVAMPNVNLLEEMADMTGAARAYEANVTAVKSAKRMALKALEIGR
ncbi:MAG: flagellar basal body rod protein FlgC [Desulfuromonas sp.]|uniref:flagellar basal body rod protein FlgC n=1 Tax=Desulfuromonas sp. TaxID=892 RepID=UPI000CA8B463|nr:flagellar basal body rod protein FlgC [Desulfuromonas sp.]PLX84502.1 MAG: flagellar basal body rod protein FlgC [Desulfuromonas sp.]